MEPKTLVLSAHMAPQAIASWQQSIVLVVTGKVDVLEEYDAEVSSPSLTLKIPAVVRLHKVIRMFKTGVKFSRSNMLARDDSRCQYCGRRGTARTLNYDHVIPRHQGGTTCFANIVMACHSCNSRKRNRTPEQAGMPLLRKPFVPKSLPVGAPLLYNATDVPDCWRPYLGACGNVRTG